MIVASSETMRNAESAAESSGIKMESLMEKAGVRVAELASKIISENKLSKVCIACGSGNNGGDGFVVARMLSKLCSVKVIIVSEVKSSLAKMNLGLLPDNVEVLYYTSRYYESVGIIKEAEMIIDAVYGIGFRGELSAEATDLMTMCNENKKAVKIAVDLPSGAVCDTGAVAFGCFRADYTVSFTALKPAHILYPAADHCGEVLVKSVGVPSRILRHCPFIMLTTDTYIAENPLPQKSKSAHKGTNGTLLALCGSYGMAGAAIMSGMAALRTGVGLLKMALPKSIYPIAATNLPEAVFMPLEQDNDGIVDIDEYGKLDDALRNSSSAALIGCGLGVNNNIKSLVALLISGSDKPIVIDADGINLISSNINILNRASAPIIITPHPGEMAKLIGSDVKTVQNDRYNIARNFAGEYGVTVVLKGANTLVALPDGRVYVNLTGNNGMAKGGSGDVLAGMAASFLAQGLSTEAAAINAVYYHGLAGDKCAEKYSKRSMLPTDIISELKYIF